MGRSALSCAFDYEEEFAVSLIRERIAECDVNLMDGSGGILILAATDHRYSLAILRALLSQTPIVDIYVRNLDGEAAIDVCLKRHATYRPVSRIEGAIELLREAHSGFCSKLHMALVGALFNAQSIPIHDLILIIQSYLVDQRDVYNSSR